MTASTDTKLRDKLMKEKLELKKTIENRNDQTKHIREKEQLKHHTGSSDVTSRKRNKRRTDTKNEKIRDKTEE